MCSLVTKSKVFLLMQLSKSKVEQNVLKDQRNNYYASWLMLFSTLVQMNEHKRMDNGRGKFRLKCIQCKFSPQKNGLILTCLLFSVQSIKRDKKRPSLKVGKPIES